MSAGHQWLSNSQTPPESPEGPVKTQLPGSHPRTCVSGLGLENINVPVPRRAATEEAGSRTVVRSPWEVPPVCGEVS